MKKIVQEGDPVLRRKAEPIPISSIASPAIRRIVKDMKEALAGEPDGVAIAAPQIGVPMRIFVVSKKALATEFDEKGEPKTEGIADLTFINPVITKRSRKQELLHEGCLSLRGVHGSIKRNEKASVEAYDELGKKFVRHGSGLLAQIFQHETDHLDGILFIDKAKKIEDAR